VLRKGDMLSNEGMATASMPRDLNSCLRKSGIVLYALQMLEMPNPQYFVADVQTCPKTT